MPDSSKSVPVTGAHRPSDAAEDRLHIERQAEVGGVFCQLASQAHCLAQLLQAEVAGDASPEMAARLVAATALAQRIGYECDFAADRLGSGVALGDAEWWFLAPSTRRALSAEGGQA